MTVTAFRQIWTVPFGPINLQQSRVFICMRMDQPIRDHGRGPLPMSVSSSLVLSVYFPFPPKTEDCIFLILESELNTKIKHPKHLARPEKSTWSRVEQAEQSSAKQRRTELNCPAREGLNPGLPHSWAASQPCCSTAMLLYSQAVSQLSCLHQINFPSTHPNLGIPVGIELAPMTIGANFIPAIKVNRKFFQYHFCQFSFLMIKCKNINMI